LIELVYAGGGVPDPVGAVVVAVPTGVVVVVAAVVVVATEEVDEPGVGDWAATAAIKARVARRRKVVKDALAIMKGAREGM